MWNVVFVMGFESLSMTARGMELGQAAHGFFSPRYSVAMAPSAYTDPKQRMRNMHVPVCVCVCMCVCVPLFVYESHFLNGS